MKLDFKTKVQLYILPLMIGYLVFYYYENHIKKPIVSSNPTIILENKKFKGNYVEIFSNIESFANSKKIEILNISRKKETIKLLAKSTLKKSKSLIEYIENLNYFTKIKKVDLNKINNQKNYFYEISISLSKYYEKDLKKYKIKEEKKNSDFDLKAIVGPYVMINKTLVKKDEKIDGYILHNIKRNYIELKRESEILKLELYSEKSK